MEQAAARHESGYIRRKEYELYHDGVLGRCPECGRLIMLPCLACQVKESVIAFDIADESVFELELHGNELLRYRQVHAYRMQHGISMFDEQQIKVLTATTGN